MDKRLRLTVLAFISAGIVVSLASGCSSRPDRAVGEPTPSVQTVDNGNEGKVVQAGGPPQAAGSKDPRREACRPAGALGQSNPTAPGPFIATFTAQPDSPLSVCGASEWDVQIHSRAPATWYSLDPMTAQHGPNCAGPPATHDLQGDHASAVFLCRDHLMTSLNADEYGVIYLTPNQLVDLSEGPVTIRIDMSTERMSKRDWIDLWLSPWEENLALPLDGTLPDLQGPPRNSIQVTTVSGGNEPILRTVREGVTREYDASWSIAPLGQGVAAGTNEAATRQQFQLTVSASRARFERLASATAPALVFWDEAIDFPFDAAVLQLGHHSYTPTKDNSGVPATWHWDNVGISRSVPFTISRSVERYADKDNPTITFEASATSESWLRFAAIGKPEVSWDGGRSWQPARRQDGQTQVAKPAPEHFSSYWMPIPTGTRSVTVRFRPDDWYQGPYFANGFAIWSK